MRRKGQRARVFAAMHKGTWRTLAEIARMTGDPTQSVSARLRDLRSRGLTVEKRRHDSGVRGLWEYRVKPERGKHWKLPVKR